MSDELLMETPESGAEVVEQETPEQPTEEQPEQQAGESDKKFSVRFSAWLKAQRDGGDPEVAKFARYGKDLEGRDRALRELYPNGVNDVRAVKAALDGLQYGEAKGIDAIGAIQDQIRDYEQSDELLASGDPKVLDLFGEEFNEGLGKLTPAILDRIQQSNPEAYSAAILPHLVSALQSSPLVAEMGSIVSVLNEQPPQWLTPNQKSDWINDKFQRLVAHVNKAADWYNAQHDAVKNVPRGTQNGKVSQPDRLSEERQQFEAQQRDYHWKTNIAPNLDKHAVTSFDQLFKPYNQRLKLDAAAQEVLRKDFVSRVVEKAAQNRQYMAQIQRYRSQKNPDPATVLNLAKVEFDKHSKGVINEIINERYRTFLGSKQNPTPRAANGTFQPQNGNGPRVVSVKPNQADIDFQRTPVDWLNTAKDGSKKYMMKDGKVTIYRPNR